MARPAEPPRTVDVAIVGAGYSGLTTALHLARAGRSVAVFDAGEIGFGCSSRNGGMYGPSFHKLGTAGLRAKYGDAKATEILREGMLALDHFEAFCAEENIDCDLQPVGRFRGAAVPGDYDAMAREGEALCKSVGLSFEMVPKSGQHAYVGSDFYHGGIFYHRDGGLHPRKLVQAIAARAETAGAALLPHHAVTGIRSELRGHVLRHRGGETIAAELVIATNGYSDRAVPSMYRRLVRMRTSGICTGELPEALIRSCRRACGCMANPLVFSCGTGQARTGGALSSGAVWPASRRGRRRVSGRCARA